MGRATQIDDEVLESLLQKAGHEESTTAGSTVWQPTVHSTKDVTGASKLEELLEYCDEICKPFVKSLAAQGKELPVVGYELTDANGGVCGDAELAWPIRRIAVLLDGAESGSQFKKQGWKVFTTSDLNSEQLIKLL